MSALSAARARAMPSPVPLVDPVTSTTLPDGMVAFFTKNLVTAA
jgi:hypothetical protein